MEGVTRSIDGFIMCIKPLHVIPKRDFQTKQHKRLEGNKASS